ncbi:MAG: response regulator transcription factor [Dehalococcoidales bacterium]|nr:response regulator transcription factor [Dehalococcoidales bacterium]
MKTVNILAVDDDSSIRKFVRANLEARGYKVLLAGDGEEAIQVIEQELPDLIILDIMMPKLDGFEVCRRIREWSKIPIIMLSAREGETDKVRCLDCGADDYLTKPFSLRELLSRIKAVLRRTMSNPKSPSESRFLHGDLVVDFSRHTVTLQGEMVELTAVEDRILQYLTMNAGRVVTSSQLLEEVWGEEYCRDFRVLQVNICRLRRKLKDNPKSPKYILTKPGIGYMVMKQD